MQIERFADLPSWLAIVSAQIWAMNQSSSVAEIDLRANVCSVKYSPVNEHELAVGSADHNVLLYDTRRCASPLHVFSGIFTSPI